MQNNSEFENRTNRTGKVHFEKPLTMNSFYLG